MFCAPNLMLVPSTTLRTSVSHGNGGQTTTSTPLTDPTAATISPASACASSSEVFIFQLPTTRGLRTGRILTTGRMRRIGRRAVNLFGALLSPGGRPDLD